MTTKYRLVNTKDVPNYSKDGEMRMMGEALGSKQIAVSYRKFPVGYASSHGHTHSKMDEVVFVIKGTLKLRLDDDVVEVGPYNAVAIAPEVKRGYRNEGDEDVEALVVSPRGSLVGDNGGTPDDNWWI